MEEKNEELEKDLQEQYALLEKEEKEDKEKKRTVGMFIVFLFLFLVMFGTTFSYIRIYDGIKNGDKEVPLKDLYIDGYKEAYQYDPNVHNYVVRVKANTTSVDVRYVLGCQNCKVEITGDDNLKPGDNDVKIVVILEDGTELEYHIAVVVDEEIPKDKDQTPGRTTPDATSLLGLKGLSVTDHPFDKTFDTNRTVYIASDIKNTESNVILKYELLNSENKVKVLINGNDYTNSVIKSDGNGQLKIDVSSDLELGDNRVEIIVSDNDGNDIKYIIHLVVIEPEEDQQVIEIIVNYGDYENGQYLMQNIIPGWESSENQKIIITNSSNYDAKVDFDWINVENSFTRPQDLEYELYKETTKIADGKLPTENANIIEEVVIEANSSVEYSIKYRYVYSNENQNNDQGKLFKANVSVSLSN